jgi:glycosyltransferase involved in cell wall biosynthesis
MKNASNSLAFVWDNFGPMHADRCDSVATALAGVQSVLGLELFSRSFEYDWSSETGSSFDKVTLYKDKGWEQVSSINVALKIVNWCRRRRVQHVFLCNYDRMAIFLAGILLRIMGKNVYVMGCSKFDDIPRTVWREAIKRYFFFMPYQGAIASGRRSQDYMRFLGIPARAIVTEYNSLSVDRIRSLAGAPPAPDGVSFEERHFTIVARFVPKKNLLMAIEAYDIYRKTVDCPRTLHICGSGSLDAALKEKVATLNLEDMILFRGFLQTDDIARVLATTLALILPSVEEQFGNVVIEAQAMGVPVLLSDVCGARDNLVRNAVNGFVFEPDNPEGLAYFMSALTESASLWRRQCAQAATYSARGDVATFSDAVQRLLAMSLT